MHPLRDMAEAGCHGCREWSLGPTVRVFLAILFSTKRIEDEIDLLPRVPRADRHGVDAALTAALLHTWVRRDAALGLVPNLARPFPEFRPEDRDTILRLSDAADAAPPKFSTATVAAESAQEGEQ